MVINNPEIIKAYRQSIAEATLIINNPNAQPSDILENLSLLQRLYNDLGELDLHPEIYTPLGQYLPMHKEVTAEPLQIMKPAPIQQIPQYTQQITMQAKQEQEITAAQTMPTASMIPETRQQITIPMGSAVMRPIPETNQSNSALPLLLILGAVLMK